MNTYIFMFLVILLIPVTMIFIGINYRNRKNYPQMVNRLRGYRTNRSMKNQDTWKFAHIYYGNLSLKLGTIILIISIIIMISLYGEDNSLINKTGLILTFVQIIFLILPIIPTEKALKKNFDELGNRRKLNK